MKCIDIYNLAMALIAEIGNASDTSDLRSRTPHILNLVVAELTPFKLDVVKSIAIISDLDDEFPLSENFAFPSAYFLASKLIADENYIFSNILYTQFEQYINKNKIGIPAVITPISNAY